MSNVGDRRIITQEYIRHECENCGEPATKTHTFLLDGARTNPRSKAYQKDDISWCSDDEAFVCGECPEPKRDGMDWCAVFSGERFKHMLHCWTEISRKATQ